MWVTDPYIFGQPAPAYSYDRVLRDPRSIRRGRPQCGSTSQVSASTMFSNTPLLKASHKVKVRFKGWKNRLHTWIGTVAESHCKVRGVRVGEDRLVVATCADNLPEPCCCLRQQPMQGLLCIWLAVSQAWLDSTFHVFPLVK